MDSKLIKRAIITLIILTLVAGVFLGYFIGFDHHG